MDREILYKLYITEEKSSDQIAIILGCGKSTVLRNLKKYQIPLRDKKIHLNKEEFTEIYLNQNKTIAETAKYFQVSEQTIIRNINSFKLNKPEELISELNSKHAKAQWKDPIKRANTLNGLKSSMTPERNAKVSKGLRVSEKFKNCVDSRKQTMLNRYGVEFMLQSDIYMQKMHNTKKRNGSYGKSIEEDKLYEKLKAKYPDVKRQYSDERYPFPCDFYIPSLDLFIEYQGHIRHGKEPFNITNPEHLEILEKWEQKAKTSKYYQGMIRCWTVLDPEKRRIAKENNLNFKEIWSV